MLEKLIIHIKNVIFLKLVVYFLVIGLLLWSIPILNEEYGKALERKDNAYKSFSEAAVKLYSIIESESKILDTYRMYEGILNTPPEYICTLKSTIIEKVRNLAAEYNTDQPTLKFSQIFKAGEQNNSSDIKIKNYDFNAKFTSSNITSFLCMNKQIYEAMPKNSIVTQMQIENEEFLDPTLISKLIVTRQPDLLKAQVNIRIREISIK